MAPACQGIAMWGACIGVEAAPSPTQMNPSPSKAIDGASLESLAKLPRQNPRVQDHFHRAHVFLFCRNWVFFLFFIFFKPAPCHASKGHISSSLDHYSAVSQLYSPLWPWLARVKLCMYFVWHRFYIVMMSYAKRKKN